MFIYFLREHSRLSNRKKKKKQTFLTCAKVGCTRFAICKQTYIALVGTIFEYKKRRNKK